MIDLEPTEEQEALVRGIGDYLVDALPVSRLRARSPNTAREVELWQALADMGFLGLGASTEAGGAGATIVEQALAFREFGRALLSTAVLGAAVGARIASTAGRPQVAQSITAGDAVVGIVIPARAGAGQADLPLDCYLTEADRAAWFAWAAPDGAWLVPREVFVGVRPVEGTDSTTSLSHARLSVLAGPALSAVGAGVARLAVLLVSATMVGLAEGALEEAVEYAKVREQFGQPIGAFQAVKHRCADMAARGMAAWAQVRYAALCLQEDLPEAPFQLAAAKLVAFDAAVRNAAADIQTHGGMGFTREVAAHHFLKRAHLLDHIGGDAAVQKAALLQEDAPL